MLAEDESQIWQWQQLCPLGTQEQCALQAFTEKREIAIISERSVLFGQLLHHLHLLSCVFSL